MITQIRSNPFILKGLFSFFNDGVPTLFFFLSLFALLKTFILCSPIIGLCLLLIYVGETVFSGDSYKKYFRYVLYFLYFSVSAVAWLYALFVLVVWYITGLLSIALTFLIYVYLSRPKYMFSIIPVVIGYTAYSFYQVPFSVLAAFTALLVLPSYLGFYQLDGGSEVKQCLSRISSRFDIMGFKFSYLIVRLFNISTCCYFTGCPVISGEVACLGDIPNFYKSFYKIETRSSPKVKLLSFEMLRDRDVVEGLFGSGLEHEVKDFSVVVCFDDRMRIESFKDSLTIVELWGSRFSVETTNLHLSRILEVWSLIKKNRMLVKKEMFVEGKEIRCQALPVEEVIKYIKEGLKKEGSEDEEEVYILDSYGELSCRSLFWGWNYHFLVNDLSEEEDSHEPELKILEYKVNHCFKNFLNIMSKRFSKKVFERILIHNKLFWGYEAVDYAYFETSKNTRFEQPLNCKRNMWEKYRCHFHQICGEEMPIRGKISERQSVNFVRRLSHMGIEDYKLKISYIENTEVRSALTQKLNSVILSNDSDLTRIGEAVLKSEEEIFTPEWVEKSKEIEEELESLNISELKCLAQVDDCLKGGEVTNDSIKSFKLLNMNYNNIERTYLQALKEENFNENLKQFRQGPQDESLSGRQRKKIERSIVPKLLLSGDRMSEIISKKSNLLKCFKGDRGMVKPEKIPIRSSLLKIKNFQQTVKYLKASIDEIKTSNSFAVLDQDESIISDLIKEVYKIKEEKPSILQKKGLNSKPFLNKNRETKVLEFLQEVKGENDPKAVLGSVLIKKGRLKDFLKKVDKGDKAGVVKMVLESPSKQCQVGSELIISVCNSKYNNGKILADLSVNKQEDKTKVTPKNLGAKRSCKFYYMREITKKMSSLTSIRSEKIARLKSAVFSEGELSRFDAEKEDARKCRDDLSELIDRFNGRRPFEILAEITEKSDYLIERFVIEAFKKSFE